MSDTQTLFGPPRGMRDFYPEDMAVRDRIFDAWRGAARSHGFAPYDACVVESLDLLKRKAGEEIVNQIYTFTDKSGRELALRPEMTPTLARMIAARQSALQFPLKWQTIAQCFRYERTTRGRKREHYQWNLDIIGEPSVAAEVEVIGTAVDALRLLGLGPSAIRVHFSSRALLGELLAASGIPAEHHPLTFLALDKRGKIADEEIEALLREGGLPAEQAHSVFALMAITTLDQAAARVPADSAALASVRRFLSLAEACGMAESLVFDIAVIRGLSYYTGIVFEAFDAGRQLRAVFGGGRYDNLFRDIGGAPATGVGLGFGDVVIAELLAQTSPGAQAGVLADLAVGFMTEAEQAAAARLAAQLRSGGARVDLALRAERAKNFFSRADRGGIPEAVFVGPDDLVRGTAKVKRLADRAEREVPLPA